MEFRNLQKKLEKIFACAFSKLSAMCFKISKFKNCPLYYTVILSEKNYHTMLSFFFYFLLMVTPYGVKKYVLHIMCITDQTTQIYLLKYLFLFLNPISFNNASKDFEFKDPLPSGNQCVKIN